MSAIQEAVARLRLDLDTIDQTRDRTGKLAERNLRWVGEPNGWRTMGELAQDIELVINKLTENSV